jgi:cytochrome c oxidase subunit 2
VTENILFPGGPAARSLADLGWWVLGTFVLVSVVMWVLLGWVALRRRGTLLEHAPWNTGGGQSWILIGGFAIPAVILGVVFVSSLRVMTAFPMGDGEPALPPPSIQVIGHQWWWEVRYTMDDLHEQVTTANEIHIPAGRPIDIELQSRDVIHSFWVPELHGKVDMVPGLVNRIRLQADAPRWFRGQCSEYCGPQHAHMMLLVESQAPADFDAWLAHERSEAPSPSAPDAVLGQEIFMRSACALCHTIRGTAARATVGPDLTHLAARRGLAANSLPNDTASLAAWITHAQSLKPSAQMPNITAFSGVELRALVAYLQTLK